MPLKFPGAWRYKPPADGAYSNQQMPTAALSEVIDLILKVATQGNRWETLEHFKGYFCSAAGMTHSWSSTESWAESDLYRDADLAAHNAPLFIEAFYDACISLNKIYPDYYAPDVDMFNELLVRNRVGYQIRPPKLELLEMNAPLVAVTPATTTLAEKAKETLQASLNRSEELLAQGYAREAVQESLWLLETVATAFKGITTGSGSVEGKYFNEIVKGLRKSAPGTTLDRVLDWTTSLHGYLSSPTGGGIRHGLDLTNGIPIEEPEARLFCNLIRSYLSYLLTIHQRMEHEQGK